MGATTSTNIKNGDIVTISPIKQVERRTFVHDAVDNQGNLYQVKMYARNRQLRKEVKSLGQLNPNSMIKIGMKYDDGAKNWSVVHSRKMPGYKNVNGRWVENQIQKKMESYVIDGVSTLDMSCPGNQCGLYSSKDDALRESGADSTPMMLGGSLALPLGIPGSGVERFRSNKIYDPYGLSFDTSY